MAKTQRRKVGRPRGGALGDGIKRDFPVTLLLSKEEARALQRAAKSAGLPRSPFIIKTLRDAGVLRG